VLRPLTHPGERDIIGLYSSFPWPVICTELAKLQLPLPSSSPLAAAVPQQTEQPEPEPEPTEPEAPTLADVVSISEIAARRAVASAGYTPGYSPDCSPKNDNDSGDPSRSRTCDLRFRKAPL